MASLIANNFIALLKTKKWTVTNPSATIAYCQAGKQVWYTPRQLLYYSSFCSAKRGTEGKSEGSVWGIKRAPEKRIMNSWFTFSST